MRIEDPNTHEALDLKEITSKTRTKEASLNEAQPDIQNTEQQKESVDSKEESKDLSTVDRSEKAKEAILEQEVNSCADANPVHQVR